ncbi:PP2C family protein-serine/threonine phosphatase [Streptomyces sp. NPDC005963]|uniref:PP2C family protein-serine/threonine phosphatase n=1 Tax=Streptomyces sp. NPDC005963 TaxID=3156721 RepID=UPI0034010A85
MDRLTAQWPYMRWLPLTIIVVTAAVDAATPAAYTGVPLIASACVLAGATLTFRATAWTGVLALGTTLLVNWHLGLLRQADGWDEVFNIVLSVIIGLDVNRMLDRYTRRLATVRSVAAAIQRAVLPEPPTRVGPLTVAARYEAADAEARIGGDAYAIQDTPYGVRILIGDVRGKGIGAVSTTSTLIGTFREAAYHVPDIQELGVRLEQSLERDRYQSPGPDHDEDFTTALIAEIDHQSHSLKLINRGHPNPYLVRAGQVTELIAATTDLPLGMGSLAAHRTTPDEFFLEPGDTLLLVTDGVTEARNPLGVFYDPTGLHLPNGAPPTPATVLVSLADSVHLWTGGPRDDDMATLAVTIA